MTIVLPLESPAERELAGHLLVVVRGLKLSRNLELAEAAIRAERQITEQMQLNGKCDEFQGEAAFRGRKPQEARA